MNKRYGLGFYLGIISVITAMITVVGGFMLGNAFPVIAFSVAGIVLFFVAVKTDLAILRLVYYICYLLAGTMFISGQLYTITNVMAGIDAKSFETGFIVAAVGAVASIIIGLVSVIPELFGKNN